MAPRSSLLRSALVLALLCGPLAARADDPPPEQPGEAAADAPADELPPLIKGPELLNFVQAPYPQEARDSAVEGVVLLLIEIDEIGAVTSVELLRPAGYGFDEAAMDAAWEFSFSPAEDEAGPVPVALEFEYGFVLDAAARDDAVPDAAPLDEPVAEAPVNLEGTLLEMGTRRPLPDFPVRVEALGLDAKTDSDGRFAFRGVPVGAVTLDAVQPGYDRATATVEVVEGQVTDFKLWIRNQSYRDDELVGLYRKEQEEVTRRTLTVAEVRRVPGTFGDPVRVIQSLPGAARTPFGTGVLILRGANPEDSAVYVDGIRVPLIYHLGGYVSVVNSDLIDAVDYLPGGYGVEYGRSLGGVVGVRTKETTAERTRVVWSTDLLDSGGLVEGRLGKEGGLGYAVAGRRSYVDAILLPILSKTGFYVAPRWWDYQVKLMDLSKEQGELSVLFFGSGDTLVAGTPDDFAQSSDQDTQGDIRTFYGFHRVIFNWKQPLGEHLSLDVKPSIGWEQADFSLGDETRLTQDVILAEVRAELPWTPSEAFTLTPGLDFLGGYYLFDVELPINPESFGDYDPLSEREPYSLSGEGSAWGPDPFVEAQIRPLTDRDALLIVPGFRLNYTTLLEQYSVFSFDPRLAVRWTPLDGTTLKAGVGQYHQPPQPFESYRPDGDVVIDDETTLSYELGWEQALSQAVQVDVTGFYKDLQSLIVTNPEFTSLDDVYFVNEGVGRIYGAELLLRHAPLNNFFGWLSYTISRSERNDYPDRGDDWYLFDFDQTHILVGVAGYKLPYDFEFSGKFQYVTGNPYTPYAGGVYDIDQDFYYGYSTGAYNSERLADYLALDLRVDKLFTFKKWQLEVYLDILNAVKGQNPEFVNYNYDYTDYRYVKGLPIIPSPGFQAEFNF